MAPGPGGAKALKTNSMTADTLIDQPGEPE
jgi:hypothetical protein